MSVVFNDVERLILERWTEVIGLLDARETLQDRLEEQIKLVADRVGRWASPTGISGRQLTARCGNQCMETRVGRSAEGAKGISNGGWLLSSRFRKSGHAASLSMGIYNPLKRYKLKDSERTTFAQALRTALNNGAKEWEAHDVDDLRAPLGNI